MSPQSSNKFIEEVMRQMFSQTQGTYNPHTGSRDETAKALQVAQDARHFAKIALQMAIGALDAADEKQEQAEKERRKAEQRQKQSERERRTEVEETRRSMEKLQQQVKEQARINEEREREGKRQQEGTIRRAAEQARNEAMKDATAEITRWRHAAKQAEQEATRLRQRAERAEEAQRRNDAKANSDRTSKDQENETASWARYTEQWDLFKRFISIAELSSGGIFRFEDIPWPMLSPPSSPSTITKEKVATFLYSSYSAQDKPLKNKIREFLLLWHPDKFLGRWMQYVIEADRARVTEGVLAVTRAGNEIMEEYASRRKTL